jgi:hypothetical protein
VVVCDRRHDELSDLRFNIRILPAKDLPFLSCGPIITRPILHLIAPVGPFSPRLLSVFFQSHHEDPLNAANGTALCVFVSCPSISHKR